MKPKFESLACCSICQKFGTSSWPAGWGLGSDGFHCPWCAWKGIEDLDPRLHPEKWSQASLARLTL